MGIKIVRRIMDLASWLLVRALAWWILVRCFRVYNVITSNRIGGFLDSKGVA